MSNISPARQVKQHLAALRAAGLDFLPAIPPVPIVFQPVEVFEEPVLGDDTESRRVSLSVMATEVANCNQCKELYSTRTQTVFGVGPLSPELCFVGEAPGADEDRQGEPFVGAAGQLLNKIITAMGLTRDEVYICNTLKCRPPRNRTPTPDECGNCRPFFEKQIELVAPKVMCCLGGVAAKNVLQTATGITRLRGKLYRYRDIPVVCTYHPSYLLRQEGPAQRQAKAEVWDDMKLILKQLGRTAPSK